MSYTRVTTLAGMTKHQNPLSRLCYLYYLINRYLVRFPPECNYKKNTEAIIAHRQSILQCAQNVEELECMIDCGTCDQLIIQAERELELMKKLLPYRPWEPLVSAPPEHQWTWPMTTN